MGLTVTRRSCQGIIVLDEMREFAGPPLSEKRHSLTELQSHLPNKLGTAAERFDWRHLKNDEDTLWRPSEEKSHSARGRAGVVLDFLLSRPESHIACVGHTNFIRQCLLGNRNREVKAIPPCFPLPSRPKHRLHGASLTLSSPFCLQGGTSGGQGEAL